MHYLIRIVLKNQNILLNLEIDKPVFNLLVLHLGRDTSRRERGELEADVAQNMARRDLFQTCFTLIKLLVARSPKGQKKMFSLQQETMFSMSRGRSISPARWTSSLCTTGKRLRLTRKTNMCFVFHNLRGNIILWVFLSKQTNDQHSEKIFI